MNDPQIQELLKKVGISDAHRRTSFTGRLGPQKKRVQVDIFDGTNNANPAHRYYATATTEDRKIATGNDGSSIQEALENLSAHLHEIE